MANYNKPVVTAAGQALIAETVSGNKQLHFTRVVTSSNEYNQEDLEELTGLDNIQQSVDIGKVSVLDSTNIEIKASINNEELTNGYLCRAIGIYAVDDNENEVLFWVTATNEPDYISAFNGFVASEIDFSAIIKVQNADNVVLSMDKSGLATIGDLENLKNEIQAENAFLYGREEIIIDSETISHKTCRLNLGFNPTENTRVLVNLTPKKVISLDPVSYFTTLANIGGLGGSNAIILNIVPAKTDYLPATTFFADWFVVARG